MASATVNGSSATLTVGYESNGSGGGDNDVLPDSSPDGGQLSLYEDVDQSSEHSTVPHHLLRSSKELSGEEEDETITGGGSDVGGCSRISYKRSSSVAALSPSPVDGVVGSSMVNSVSEEKRSSKKRRKQSNPVRLTTTRLCDTDHGDFVGAVCREVTMDLSVRPCVVVEQKDDENDDVEMDGEPIPLMRREDLDEDGDEEGGVYRCLHCNVLFGSEERLRNHVEEEHVQKALEQQIQQQNQKNFYPNSNANPFDLGSSLSIRTSVAGAVAVTADGSSSSSEPSTQDVKPDLDRFSCSFQQQQQQHHAAAVASLNQAAAVAALQNSKDVANLMALSAFGAAAAPFLIPLVPSSVVGSSGLSNASRQTPTTHSAGMNITSSGSSPSTVPNPHPPPIRIFNPEAFCELCNKEFCNKYFLKTHKANKHGIYSMEALTGVSATTASGTVASLTQASSLSTVTRPHLQGSPTEMSENSSVCTVSNGGVMVSSVATSMANALNNGGGGVVTGSGVGNLLLGTSMLGKGLSAVMNPEAFCIICQKEFCNKYFLRKHRQKIHGIQESQSTSAFSPVTSSSPSSSLAIVTSHMDSSAPSAVTLASEMNSIGGGVPISSSHGPLSSPLDLCFEFGVRDLSAKITAAAALMQQASAAASSTPPKHSIQSLVALPTSSTTVTTSCSPSGTPLISNLTSTGSGFLVDHSKSFIPGSVTVAGHVFSPDRLREMGVINLDAFCEICCKEFCNKYFLRTHKLNKHGIGSLDMMSVGSLPKGPGMMSLQQSTPLSLVVDKEGGIGGGGGGLLYEDGGRKSATPNSSNSSSSSSSSSTSNSSGSGCLVSTTNANVNGGSVTLLGCSDLHHIDANSGMVPMELTCDVCSRPFSSGYLLKMHKFYFHNIGDLSSLMPVTDADLIKMEPKTSVTPEEEEDHTEDRCSSTGNNGRRSVGGDVAASEHSAAATAAALAVLSSAGNQPLNEDLQKLQTMIRELNTSPQDGSVKCNICFREMKNKYFLRAHVMNEHGELHNEDDTIPMMDHIKKESSSGVERDGCSSSIIVSASSSSSTPGNAATTSSAIALTPTAAAPSLSISKSPVSSAYDSESFCDLCGKEFCSKYFVRAHKLTVHGINRDKGNSESPPMMSMTTTNSGLDGTNSSSSSTSHLLPVPLDKIKTEGGVVVASSSAPSVVVNSGVSSTCTQQPLAIPLPPPSQLTHIQSHHHHAHHHHHSPVSLSALDRNNPPSSSSVVTGRNFCEICNKELCNKYFMKTHMLKMHGINVDEKSFVNGATIGGVTCDICQKELCSKYFLKVHKQNTHGIFEEPMMSKENNYSTTGGMAMSMSPDKDGGILGYHLGEVDPSVGNNIGGSGGGGGGGNRYFSHYTEVCPLCDRRFKSIKWLKTHIINDHADLAKDTGFGDVFRELFFGVGDSPSQIGSSGRSSSSHQFVLSLTDGPPFGGAKVDKMSSTSSSTTTSPNATATSPFPHLPHTLQQHLKQQQHQHHRHSHHDNNDAIGTGGGNGGGGLGGGGAAIHHAGELGSTGAALAAAGSTMMAATTPPSASSMGHGSGVGSPCLANKKPLASGNGTRIYHCSYCSYSTRWLSNLYAHEKRHTGLSSEGEKRFSCRVCHRAYRYNHSLQRHLMSHKTTGFLLKHAGNSSLLMSSHHMSAAMASLNQQNQGSNEGGSTLTSSNRHDSLQSPVNIGGRLRYPDDDEEEEEEEEDDDDEVAAAARMRERCVRSVNLVARSPKISSTSHSAKTGLSRVKKYRCSKCGAKYRSREQCLEHIHLHHNTRNRHHRHHHHHSQHHQHQNEVQTSKDKHHGVVGSNGGGGGGGDVDSSFLDRSVSPSPLHNCPRCTFSCSSQEELIDHLGRHHCGSEDETKSPPHISGVDGGDDGSGDEVGLSRQDSFASHGNIGHSQIPMTYAVPQAPPSAGSFIMQPFLMCQPEEGGGGGGGGNKTPPSSTFVPSLVYLPVSHKVTDTITVSFNLTPA